MQKIILFIEPDLYYLQIFESKIGELENREKYFSGKVKVF